MDCRARQDGRPPGLSLRCWRAVFTANDSEGGVTATPAPTEFCGCPSASGIAAATCGATCPDSILARTYVTVGASTNRVTIFPGSLPLPTVLTASVTTRVQ